MLEELPDLPFRLILGLLSYEDRFSLRKTCKRLKSLLDGQVCQNLFVFLDCCPYHQCLFHTGELVYYPDSCRIPNFNRFISSKQKENFKSIRKLTIYFKGLCILKEYPSLVEVDLKSLKKENFLKEVWRLEINLEDLNFFEQVELLEIKEIGRVFGQLKLKNLKILSVETRRLSEFDLDCEQLKAMRISLGARPNFINPSNHIDCLSTGLFLFEGTFDYIRKLFDICPNLITIGFQYPGFLKFTLFEINAGSIQLPLLRVIKLEESQYLRSFAQILQELVQYEKSIEPERLQFVYNDHSISLEQFASIVQVGKKFRNLPDKPNNSLTFYLKYLKENKATADLSCLFWGISKLYAEKDYIEIDEDLVIKLKHLEEFRILSDWPRIDETLLRLMFTTWTKLRALCISDPDEQVGQHLLNQMPSNWPNLHSLEFFKKPENLKFVTDFKNLREFFIRFDLPREEMMFLLQTFLSLNQIHFGDESAGFKTIFITEKRWKYWKKPKNLSEHILNPRKFTLIYYRIDTENSQDHIHMFTSLEKMIDYFYQNDLSTGQSILIKMDKLRYWLLSRIN